MCNLNTVIAFRCPSMYRGAQCQLPCNVCLNSVSNGLSCDEENTQTQTIQRWYFDKKSQTCQQFTYKGNFFGMSLHNIIVGVTYCFYLDFLFPLNTFCVQELLA